MNYKLKYTMLVSLIESLKEDLNHRLYKCEDCKFTLEYLNYITDNILQER